MFKREHCARHLRLWFLLSKTFRIMAQVLYMYPLQNNGNPAALFEGLRSNRPPGANNQKQKPSDTEGSQGSETGERE